MGDACNASNTADDEYPLVGEGDHMIRRAESPLDTLSRGATIDPNDGDDILTFISERQVAINDNTEIAFNGHTAISTSRDTVCKHAEGERITSVSTIGRRPIPAGGNNSVQRPRSTARSTRHPHPFWYQCSQLGA
ncbi:MAG: hypothetical protein AAGI30_09445 [Planctomycetota bacterium]